jgi:hypothetical protein
MMTMNVNKNAHATPPIPLGFRVGTGGDGQTEAGGPTAGATPAPPWAAAGGGPGPALPPIEHEPPDAIHVGAGGKLVVPREDLLDDLDDGTEFDLVAAQPMKVRRPDRREWVALNPASELPTRLLLHKPRADGIEVEHYFVDKPLRGPIRDELKDVRVFVYHSLRSKTFGLWVVNVTLENSWYESLAGLFRLPAEFFAQHVLRVISDKANSRYRVRHKPLTTAITWPNKDTGALLAEAFGPERFITSPDHPIYRDLVDGTELS